MFSSCRFVLVSLSIMLIAPSAFAEYYDYEGIHIMLSGGGLEQALSGDLNRIAKPLIYAEASVGYKFDSIIFINGAFMISYDENDDLHYALIPSIGLYLPLGITDLFATTGIGPYLYDKKLSCIIDIAVGGDIYFLKTVFFNITNHFNYRLGFYSWSYHLMAGVGIRFW